MLFDNQLRLDMMFLMPAKAKSLLLDILHYPTPYLVIPNVVHGRLLPYFNTPHENLTGKTLKITLSDATKSVSLAINLHGIHTAKNPDQNTSQRYCSDYGYHRTHIY